MRLFIIVSLLVIGFNSKSDAQRIRYKNLFPILQSKDYKTAEPQLLKYLEDNDDEANAYFYLGEIIVSKLDSIEIFPTTEKYDSMANKAIEAYKKAITLVDDREVRKNDEYYAAYNRRDLRTGKFEIKKSDIHLDYENKIKAVSKKTELIKEIHELKAQSADKYKNLNIKVEEFYNAYPDEISFVLRANSFDIEASQEIINSFKKFTDVFRNFVDKLNSLNHPAYSPELKTVEIVNWDGLKPIQAELSDFSVSVQDYEQYLSQLNEQIDNQVKELKSLLFRTDAKFNEAISKNRTAIDSTQIQKMTISEELKTALKKYDKSDVIVNLLRYKQYKSQSELLRNQNIYPVLRDSSNIYQRANLVEDYQHKLNDQYDLLVNLDEKLNERIVKNFQLFMDGFMPSIEAYLETELTIAKQKLDSATKRSELMASQIKFFVYDSDSIYMTPMIAANRQSSNYIMNTIELDSLLLIGGVLKKQPFIAMAGFDMQINKLEILRDSTFTINNMFLLNSNLMLNLRNINQENTIQFLFYFSPNLEEIWSLEYENEATLGDAKVEAGIFFIYDQDGNVLKTLNSQGEIIGN